MYFHPKAKVEQKYSVFPAVPMLCGMTPYKGLLGVKHKQFDHGVKHKHDWIRPRYRIACRWKSKSI